MASRNVSKLEAPLSRAPNTVKSEPEIGTQGRESEDEEGVGPREGYSCQSSHTERTGRGQLWRPEGWAPSSSSEVPTFSSWQKGEGCVVQQQLEWK